MNIHDIEVVLNHERYHGENHCESEPSGKDSDVEHGDGGMVNHLNAFYYSITNGDSWSIVSENFRKDYNEKIKSCTLNINDPAIRLKQEQRTKGLLYETK
ncbi:MAG: hypothetical protein H6607_09460 [Flavobacteriales bacterium]|nr:hypothetical protein [Flavobacteriales bacterium]